MDGASIIETRSPPAPLISLLTDFGVQDEYVGVMKGVIAGIHPGVRLVDITHRIDPQDVTHGAYVLAAAFSYFPPGTIHVAVVDPGVGGDRRIVAVTVDGHHFLAPDNGLLERVLDRGPVEAAVAVTASRYFLQTVSQTFHGRDIFAPVAAHLARGIPLTALGPAVPGRSLVTGVVPRWRFETGTRIRGAVVAVDRFGNLMTNIDAAAITTLRDRLAGKPMVVALAGKTIGGLVSAYGEVAIHEPLAIMGSRDLLEISVNRGDARQLLAAGKGERVFVGGG